MIRKRPNTLTIAENRASRNGLLETNQEKREGLSSGSKGRDTEIRSYVLRLPSRLDLDHDGAPFSFKPPAGQDSTGYLANILAKLVLSGL